MSRQYRYLSLLIVLFSLFLGKWAVFSQEEGTDSTIIPEINYNATPQKYEIAEITVTGAENYEDFVLIGFPTVSGDVITVPGNEISDVVKRFGIRVYSRM